VLLILLYVGEGLARLTGESAVVSALATTEIVLALAFFASAIGYIRSAGRAAAGPARETGTDAASGGKSTG
jgi:uncharacterized membrane protein